MDGVVTWIKGAVAAIGGLMAYIWGPWDTLVSVLVAFVALDYVMGVINATIKGTLSSQIGFKGLAKKVAIFFMIAVASLLDKVVPVNGAIRAAVCMFYIANEGISVLENAGSIGLPLPNVLKKALAQLKTSLKYQYRRT